MDQHESRVQPKQTNIQGAPRLAKPIASIAFHSQKMSQQRDDNHPYMSKSQLDEYLSSLRTSKRDSYSRAPQHQQRMSEDRGSTPLVRALREKYGNGNTTAGYVDVGMMKRAESPGKRALPPVPGAKTESSTGWKVGHQRGRSDVGLPLPAKREERSPERRDSRSPERRMETRDEFTTVPRERSPPKRGDFWTTGVAPNIVLPGQGGQAPASKQRPLPPDPRDELYLPRVEDLSISDPEPSSAPSISVPTINAPSINVPSINAPSSPDPPSKPERSWQNIHTRTISSPALLCAICNRPISGRIVTAIGHRFHPECFRCATCSTELVLPSPFICDSSL
jgi:hypothetical protein